MIIECPECGTKYTVKEEAIKPRGRTVRCAKCATSWHIKAIPTAVEEWEDRFKPDPEMVTDARVRASTVDAPVQEQPEPPEEEPAEPQAQGEPEHAAEPEHEPEVIAPPVEDDGFIAAPRRIRAAPPPEPVKHDSKAASILAVAAAIVLLLGGIVLARKQLEHIWPATGRLYQVANLDPAPPGTGLDLKNVHAYLDKQANGDILTVEAAIQNTSKAPVTVPGLHAILQSANGPARDWTFSSGTSELAPQATVNVKAAFDGAQTENGKILLTFATQNVPDSK